MKFIFAATLAATTLSAGAAAAHDVVVMPGYGYGYQTRYVYVQPAEALPNYTVAPLWRPAQTWGCGYNPCYRPAPVICPTPRPAYDCGRRSACAYR